MGFDEHPSFSLVKNPQNGGPGEISGPGAWAAEGVEAKRAKTEWPSVSS
jgi:hypothetical protein